MFADIGKFLHDNIVVPIDKGVIKPIDRHIVRPIREATDKDYALRHETARIAKLRAENAPLRPAFYTAQEDLAVAEAAYERASEDFTQSHGVNAFRNIGAGGLGTLKRVDPKAGLPDVIKVIDDGSRFILKTVSLGLTEAIYNIDEIPRERAFLRRQITQLTQEGQQLRAAIATLQAATDRYTDATAQVHAEHAKLGDDINASDVHVIVARQAAQTKIITRLLDQGVAIPSIAELTGADIETIQGISDARQTEGTQQ